MNKVLREYLPLVSTRTNSFDTKQNYVIYSSVTASSSMTYRLNNKIVKKKFGSYMN